MDLDNPSPHCPYCGTPMRAKESLKASFPNDGSALPAFECKACNVLLTVPPGAKILQLATR